MYDGESEKGILTGKVVITRPDGSVETLEYTNHPGHRTLANIYYRGKLINEGYKGYIYTTTQNFKEILEKELSNYNPQIIWETEEEFKSRMQKLKIISQEAQQKYSMGSTNDSFFKKNQSNQVLTESNVTELVQTVNILTIPHYRCELIGQIEQGYMSGQMTITRPDGKVEFTEYSNEKGYRSKAVIYNKQTQIYSGYIYYAVACFNPIRGREMSKYDPLITWESEDQYQSKIQKLKIISQEAQQKYSMDSTDDSFFKTKQSNQVLTEGHITELIQTVNQLTIPHYSCDLIGQVEIGYMSGQMTITRPDSKVEFIKYNNVKGYRIKSIIYNQYTEIFSGYIYYKSSCFNPIRGQELSQYDPQITWQTEEEVILEYKSSQNQTDNGIAPPLGKEGAFSKYKVLIYVAKKTENTKNKINGPQRELKKRGFSYDIIENPLDLINKIMEYDILWIIPQLNNPFQQQEVFLESIGKFMKAGRGLFLFGDNDNFYYETNLILGKYFNDMYMRGNYDGKQIITKSNDNFVNDKKGKFNPNHPVFTNTIDLYEGHTISTIFNIHSDFVTIAHNTNNEPMILFAEANEHHGRIIIDAGYTKLFDEYWNSAGTQFYISNANVHLLGIPGL